MDKRPCAIGLREAFRTATRTDHRVSVCREMTNKYVQQTQMKKDSTNCTAMVIGRIFDLDLGMQLPVLGVN